MKKFFYLFAVLALVSLSACNESDEPTNIQTATMVINSRAIDGDDMVFSQGSSKVELDYTNMFIKFTADYRDINGQSHTITTPDMKLYIMNSSIYKFDNIASNEYTGIEQLTGYIDFATGMMWYSFKDASSKVVSSSQFLYAYTTTTVTNPDNGYHFSHEQSAYLFALDARGETCTMKISNFIPNINGSVQASEIQYKDLTVTPTTTGYIITADEVESSYKGFFSITDLNIILNNQCMVIGGSFKSNDLEFSINGSLFPDTGTPVL